MKRKLAVALNMLSPYWHEAFENLSHRDWDITIFVATEKEKDREYHYSNYSNYSFFVKKSHNLSLDLSRFGIKTRFLHFPMGLWKDLKKCSPDVILSNDLGFRTIVSLIYGKLYQIPVVPWIGVSAYTERNNSRIREFIRRCMLKNVKCVCTNMTEAKMYFVDSLSISPEKIYQTPYAVNVDAYNANVLKHKHNAAFYKKELGLHGTVLLYVGQMIERKGLQQLIEALIELKDDYREKYSILIVGGELAQNLTDMLNSKRICFKSISFVQPDNLYQFYAVADAFIFPSLEDEWGIVLNEAAASGLPLISSIYAAASTELVKDGINGYRFDPFNRAEVVNIIKTFLDLPEETRKHYGAESLNIVKRLDLHLTVDQIYLALHRAFENVN